MCLKNRKVLNSECENRVKFEKCHSECTSLGNFDTVLSANATWLEDIERCEIQKIGYYVGNTQMANGWGARTLVGGGRGVKEGAQIRTRVAKGEPENCAQSRNEGAPAGSAAPERRHKMAGKLGQQQKFSSQWPKRRCGPGDNRKLTDASSYRRAHRSIPSNRKSLAERVERRV